MPNDQQPNSFEATAANTPASLEINAPQGEFARLIPSSRLARLAFSQVVEKILHDPDEYIHISKFIRFTKAGEEDGFSELSDLSEGVRAPSPPFRLWNGHYNLDLKVPPAKPQLGWILGSRCASADLLLASKQGLHNVGGNHLRLSFNRDTGCLMAVADDRSVSICGSFGTVRLKGDSRALTEQASLSIGDLQYDFEYQRIEEDTHRQGLEQFMQVELGQMNFELSGDVSSLGSDTDVQLKDYTVKGVFAAGTSAMVAGAIVKATGEYVAVKKLRRARQDDPTIVRETEALGHLHREYRHVCFVYLRLWDMY